MIKMKFRNVTFEFAVKFEGEVIPEFTGKETLALQGEPTQKEITSKIQEFVMNSMQKHLRQNNAPANLKASLSLKVIKSEGTVIEVKLEPNQK